MALGEVDLGQLPETHQCESLQGGGGWMYLVREGVLLSADCHRGESII